MAKLQKIKRSNGSVVYSVNIPLEIIEELEWEKGVELSMEIQKVRVGKSILVFRDEDKINEQEEKNDTNI